MECNQNKEMDVTEKPAERLPDDSVANLVGTSIEQQESALLSEDKADKNHSTNGQSIAMETDNDKTLTLPSDIPMKEGHEIPGKADDEVAAAVNGAKENSGALERNQENKNEGITSDQNRNQSETSQKLHHEEVTALKAVVVATPKAEAESMRDSNNWLIDPKMGIADESGTLEEQAAFMKELERFHKDRALEFKPPKFYGEPLNCLKLWRAVVKLGGYDVVRKFFYILVFPFYVGTFFKFLMLSSGFCLPISLDAMSVNNNTRLKKYEPEDQNSSGMAVA